MTWIPHTIPKTTLQLFVPLKIRSVPCKLRPDEDQQHNSNIDSADFSWADCTPKLLKFLCLDAIANDFARYPEQLFEWLDPADATYLVEILSTGLPITSVIHVPGGEYWRRRHDDTWPPNNTSVQVTRHHTADVEDRSKTFYLTKYVSDVIENLEPGYVDETEVSEIFTVCSPYVTAIDCRQLRIRGPMSRESEGCDPIHVDLSFVLSLLKNIRTMSLVYGYKFTTLSTGFAPERYRFHIDDMDTLGRGLVLSENLTSLAITKSDLNFAKFNRLLPHLTECHGLEEINFSFCKLGCLGGKSVAHFVKTAKTLKLVNLCHNNIGPDGVEALSFVMLWRRNNNFPAIELNLNMNNISDMGAKYLAFCLASGVQPFTKLLVRNCNITETGGINIAQSLEFDRGLRVLEIDNNPLTLEVAIALHTTLKTNLNIAYLSVQNCNFSQTMTNFLSRVAFYNRHNKRSELVYVNVENLYDVEEEKNISQEDEMVESETVEDDVVKEIL